MAETLEYDSEDPERNINGWIFAFSFGELAPLNKENTMHLGKFLFLFDSCVRQSEDLYLFNRSFFHFTVYSVIKWTTEVVGILD